MAGRSTEIILTDNSQEWLRSVLAPALEAGLEAYAIDVQTEIMSNFGSEGGGVVGQTSTGRNIYQAAPPGKYPGVRSGRLRNSITYEVDGTEAAIGTNVYYGRILEFGNNRVAARPWLARSHTSIASKAFESFSTTVREKLR